MFGEGTTYDSIETRYRQVKKQAKELQAEIASGVRPAEAPPTPRKRKQAAGLDGPGPTKRKTPSKAVKRESGTASPITKTPREGQPTRAPVDGQPLGTPVGDPPTPTTPTNPAVRIKKECVDPTLDWTGDAPAGQWGASGGGESGDSGAETERDCIAASFGNPHYLF
jgi:hypothetical protein